MEVRKNEAREGDKGVERELPLSSRVSLARPVLSGSHYFQAPAMQARMEQRTKRRISDYFSLYVLFQFFFIQKINHCPR